MKNLLLFIGFFIITLLSSAQGEFIRYVHNGYIFRTDIKTIVDNLRIEKKDSVQLYLEELRAISAKNTVYTSDQQPQFRSESLSFSDIIRIFHQNHSFVQITRASDGELVRYKVKTKKKIYPSNGIGEFSETFLILIDKKKRKEIVRQVIKTALPC